MVEYGGQKRMIKAVHLDTSPIQIGVPRWLSAEGDGPFAVEIKCHVSNPPPPGYRACPECGSFNIDEFEPLPVIASHAGFPNGQGTLDITITDRLSDSKKFRLVVVLPTIQIKTWSPASAPSSGNLTSIT